MAQQSTRLAFILVLLALLVLAGASVWHSRTGTAAEALQPHVDAPVTPEPQAPIDPELAHLALQRETDAREVFRRAFWRNPGAQDRILDAVRREWSDAHGVQRWDWFISVAPSPELCAYLLEQNPFQLSRGTDARTLERVPHWFPQSTEGWTSYQSAGAEMLILHDPARQRLYAMSQGYGFTRATPEPAPSPPPAQPGSYVSSGRLPDASPPTPARAP